jgi:hypothetical protein
MLKSSRNHGSGYQFLAVFFTKIAEIGWFFGALAEMPTGGIKKEIKEEGNCRAVKSWTLRASFRKRGIFCMRPELFR